MQVPREKKFRKFKLRQERRMGPNPHPDQLLNSCDDQPLNSCDCQPLNSCDYPLLPISSPSTAVSSPSTAVSPKLCAMPTLIYLTLTRA